jgi:predicted nucleic acid-binding protein
MMIVLDANVLLRIADPNSAHHQVASAAPQRLCALQHQPVVVPQSLF